MSSAASTAANSPRAATEKHEFLRQLRRHIPADDYVMVGNIPGISGASEDSVAAEHPGWGFVR